MKRWSLRAFSSVTLAFLAVICAAGISVARAADDLALTRAVDLQADAKEAQAKKIPLVLFSNLTGCHYCRGALREVLLPMQRDAGWARTAIYRQIDVDKTSALIDFEGNKTTHEKFAIKYKLTFTPTVLVVDSKGAALADPIVGIAGWDFYGTYVEEAIKKGFDAQQKLGMK
jgi:thioredoxin-related protein